MAKEKLQFKCFVCYSVVNDIPYCGECEISLPNCTKIEVVKKSIFSGKLRSEVGLIEGIKKYKCINCSQPNYCAFKGYCLEEHVHKNNELLAKQGKLKHKNVLKSGEDADLFNDFENKKAASIISIIHSGINRKKLKASGGIIKGRRKSVYGRDNFTCLKCGSKEDLTLDHVVPLSKGGKNRIDNLQTLCYDCNQKKKDTVADYRQMKVVA